MELETLPEPILELILHHFSIAINTKAEPRYPQWQEGVYGRPIIQVRQR